MKFSLALILMLVLSASPVFSNSAMFSAASSGTSLATHNMTMRNMRDSNSRSSYDLKQKTHTEVHKKELKVKPC